MAGPLVLELALLVLGCASPPTSPPAVLRDYARLGLLLAHDGNWRGRQIIPAAWIKDATTVREDQSHLRPGLATPFFGYGYQTWIFPGERRMVAFLGVRGQAIHVGPQSRLVLVHTAVRKQSVDPGSRETGALWQSVVRTLGSWAPCTDKGVYVSYARGGV